LRVWPGIVLDWLAITFLLFLIFILFFLLLSFPSSLGVVIDDCT
jgi:hypothetical protein